MEKRPVKPKLPQWFFEYSKPVRPRKPQAKFKTVETNIVETIHFEPLDGINIAPGLARLLFIVQNNPELEIYMHTESTSLFNELNIKFDVVRKEVIETNNPSYKKDLAEYKSKYAEYKERLRDWEKYMAVYAEWKSACQLFDAERAKLRAERRIQQLKSQK